MTPSANPLPTVIEAYCRITGQDAVATGKRIPSGEIVVPCVAKQNHKHGDAEPSLRINLEKDVWRCDPCAAQGIEGGRSAHLAVASGVASSLSEASRWLARPKPKRVPQRGDLTAEYDYRDAEGNVLYQVRRFEFEVDGKKGKTFSQRRGLPGGGWEGRLGDVERVPFRLPEMIQAINDGENNLRRRGREGRVDARTARARRDYKCGRRGLEVDEGFRRVLSIRRECRRHRGQR